MCAVDHRDAVAEGGGADGGDGDDGGAVVGEVGVNEVVVFIVEFEVEVAAVVVGDGEDVVDAAGAKGGVHKPV